MDKSESAHTEEELVGLKEELGHLLKEKIPVYHKAKEISKFIVSNDIDDPDTYLTAMKEQDQYWRQLQKLDSRIGTITRILLDMPTPDWA